MAVPTAEKSVEKTVAWMGAMKVVRSATQSVDSKVVMWDNPLAVLKVAPLAVQRAEL